MSYNFLKNEQLTPQQESARQRTRRHFLRDCQVGLGAMAFASLSSSSSSAAKIDIDPANPLQLRAPHFPAKAKHIIYLHMAGSPPHLDIFDYKPELVKRDGEDCPDEILNGRRFAFTSGKPKLMGTPRKFAQYGETGTWLSDAVPHFRRVVDDIAVVKSMNTDQFNHAPAELLVYTGSPRSGRPSLGAWVTYGLGSENENLPGFVVLISSGSNPSAGKSVWGSGFLPSVFQGVQCRSKGDPVLFVSNPKGMSREMRRKSLDALRDLNQIQAEALGDPETATRISQFELAYRMQMSVPGVMDISRETQQTLDAYGAQPGESSLANNCLLARRMVEQGVRYVQVFDWGWDFHGTNPKEDIREGLTEKCRTMD
ncbi:MAG: DUF1501 domain-containing protein, partial [Planctomycetales bacterium]|nr:DUF1501 domain-containing protein [Planctomycetales bacterium]